MVDIKTHPSYYDWSEYEDYEGTAIECIKELCNEFPYVTEAKHGFSINWFFDNVKNRFTFVSKNSKVMSVFFDDIEEVKAFHSKFGLTEEDKKNLEPQKPKKKKRKRNA